MPRFLPPLGGLRAFEATARLGSLRAAAAELGVTPGAVSQQVKGLETHLNVRLFERGAHSLNLTLEGQRYLPVLRDAFDAIAGATQSLSKTVPPATVELSMPALFASGWMLPRLDRFRAAHRDVDLRIRSSNRLMTPGTENAIAAIRHGRAGWDNLVSVHLFGDALVPVCHPAVAAGLARGSGGRMTLDGATILVPEDGDAPWDQWRAVTGISGAAQELALGDEGLVVQAALNSLGLALVDRHVVEEPLNQGRLVTPFEAPPWRRGTAWYLVYRGAHDRETGLAAVRDWLLAETTIATP